MRWVLDELQPPVAIHRVGNVDEQRLRNGEPRVGFQHVHDLLRVVPCRAGVPQRQRGDAVGVHVLGCALQLRERRQRGARLLRLFVVDFQQHGLIRLHNERSVSNAHAVCHFLFVYRRHRDGVAQAKDIILRCSGANSCSTMLRPMIAQTGNLRQWQYFVALAETGSFTAAAARLGVSQPPVSNAIKRLEAGVGTPLFIRGAGEVKLTEAGLTLLPYARVINRDLQTMHSMIDGIRSGAQSGFRLAISSALPSEIGSRIAAKAQQHDGVVLSSLPSVEILARVEEGAIHAGLVQAPVPLGIHRSARQFSLSRDLVVPPGYSRLDKTLSQLNLLVENLNDNSSAASGLARELFRSGVSCEINDSEDALGRGLLIGRGEGMSLVFRGFHQFDNAIELPSRFDFSVDVVVRRGGMDNGAEAMAVAERICRRINQ